LSLQKIEFVEQKHKCDDVLINPSICVLLLDDVDCQANRDWDTSSLETVRCRSLWTRISN
jgi:hypothetical protein